MTSVLATTLRKPAIRTCALVMLAFGTTGAATTPYMAVVGIREFGLSDFNYSILMLLSALVNVASSVLAGSVADRFGNFRGPMLGAAAFGMAGFASIYLAPSAGLFVCMMLSAIPIHNSLNSLIFAQSRAAATGLSVRELISLTSFIRSLISLAWVIVPGTVGYFLADGGSMLPIFLLASLASTSSFLLIQFFLPGPHRTATPPPAFALAGSFRLLASRSLLVRMLALALLMSTLSLNGAVLPLIVTGQAGGRSADVGVIVGIVAFLEIGFMILWGRLTRLISPIVAILIGGSMYSVYLALLGFAPTVHYVYALTLLSGCGGAAIISLPLSYMQNLIADRAGLGSSLIAVNVFMSACLSSTIFAIGTAVSDYSGTAIMGACAALVGGVLMAVLDLKKTTS